MKNLIVLMFAFGLMNLTACTNTMEGVGKDLEKMGDSIQKSAERLEKKFDGKKDEDEEEKD
jgi:predicted small secreted protein